MMNKNTKTEPPIIHSPGTKNKDYNETNPCWNLAQCISKRAKSKSLLKTTIVLCNNVKDSITENCLSSMGIPYVALGKDIKDWDNILKMELVLNYIEKYQPLQVLYMDSIDVVVVGDIGKCDCVLEEHKCKMLFSSETKFYPRCPSLMNVEEFEKEKSPNQYFALNAGCWIGYSEFLAKVLKEALSMDMSHYKEKNSRHLEEYRITKSDQFRWHILYQKHYPDIKLDHFCEIFQSLYLHEHSDFHFKLL